MIENPSPSKVAAIQMCSSHLIDDNLQVAHSLIQMAAESGAKFIALPENFALMGLSAADKFKAKETFGQGKIQDFLAKIAKEYRVWVVGGTIPLASKKEDKITASCLVFNDQGEFVARYDKIHLFDATVSENETHQESNLISPGKDIIVFDTPLGKVGLAICFDLRFPSLFTSLAKEAVEILVIPSAFTQITGKAHWDILTHCRAIDTFSYLIAPAQGGTHTNGRHTYGHTLIINPWGETLAKTDGITPGVVTANIDLAFLKKVREAIPLHYA